HEDATRGSCRLVRSRRGEGFASEFTELLEQSGGNAGHGCDAGAKCGFGVGFELAGVRAWKQFAGSPGGGEAVRVHGAEAKVADRDFAVEAEEAYVLAAHNGMHRDDVFRAESFLESGTLARGERRIVVLDWSGLVVQYSDGRCLFGRQAGGGGDAGRHLLEAVDDALTAGGGEGACSELELHLIGDDVALGAAVDVADGDDGWILRVLFAADDGLHLRDVERSEGDRVAADLRSGAVAADPVDDDIDRGGAGHGVAREEADLACGELVGVVQADDEVGTTEALVEMVGEHGFGAVDGLLGWLADEHERAVPLVF